MALWETNYDEDEEESIWGSSGVDFSELTGASLYKAAEEICLEQVPQDCASDMVLLRNMYSRQITSDCKGYEVLMPPTNMIWVNVWFNSKNVCRPKMPVAKIGKTVSQQLRLKICKIIRRPAPPVPRLQRLMYMILPHQLWRF